MENSNINTNYKGDIRESDDLYAYIDESGDDGFNFQVGKSSVWFNVSGLICTPIDSRLMLHHLKMFVQSRKMSRPLHKLSSKDINHNQLKDVLIGLHQIKYHTIHSIFYKPKIDPKDRLITYPSMYFVGVKNVIERITWLTSQLGKRRAHVVISARNNIETGSMKSYLFQNSVIANKNMTYHNKLGIVKVCKPSLRPMLVVADYAAYTLRMTLEGTGEHDVTEPYYFEWFQKDRLYSSCHAKYGGIWRNGLKCTPDDISLIQHGGILDEGSHKP
jgi:hypothetical protein